jgi:hypothetical protein
MIERTENTLREHTTLGFGIPDVNSVKDARFFYEFHKKKIIEVVDGYKFVYPKSMGYSEALQLYLWGCVFGEGPKIFAPLQLDFEALENMDINLGIEDYNQPFSTIVIEIPDDYANKRISTSTATGKLQSPKTAILHFVPGQMLLASVYTNGNRSYICRLLPIDGTIQDSLTKLANEKSEVINPDEEINFTVIKAAINACLIMDEVGVKRTGYKNPNYAGDIERRIARKANVERNKLDLFLHPSVFGFAQNVSLFDSEGENPAVSDGHGTHVSCHWRRGHWRMQVHGPGNTLRKRIRIKPVMINKKLFVGSLADAKASYKLG